MRELKLQGLLRKLSKTWFMFVFEKDWWILCDCYCYLINNFEIKREYLLLYFEYLTYYFNEININYSLRTLGANVYQFIYHLFIFFSFHIGLFFLIKQCKQNILIHVNSTTFSLLAKCFEWIQNRLSETFLRKLSHVILFAFSFQTTNVEMAN